MRCIKRRRLSHRTEATTSLERQDEIINGWGALHGHEFVGDATDVNVSGAVHPMRCPELGPWFERPDMWDAIVVWKLDRLSRSTLHFAELLKWCQENGKTIISVSEGFDLSAPLGRMIAQIIIMLAEGELENIKERTRGSRAYLRSEGRYPGGSVSYGYKAQKNEKGNGWTLTQDRASAPVLEKIIGWVLDDKKSLRQIAYDLNAEQVPSPRDHQRVSAGKEPKGTAWSPTGISEILRSESLLGHMLHDGKPVRDRDGKAIVAGKPYLDREKFDLLQAELDRRSNPRERRSKDAALLLKTAHCGVCGQRMYRNSTTTDGKRYFYYRCNENFQAKKRCTSISAAHLETYVQEEYLRIAGTFPVMRRIEDPGVDLRSQVAEVRASICELMGDRQAGLYQGETATARYRQMMEALESREAELAAVPVEPPSVRYVPTGETCEQRWARCGTDAERRQMLLDAGAHVIVFPRTKNTGPKFDPDRVFVTFAVYEGGESGAVDAAARESQITHGVPVTNDRKAHPARKRQKARTAASEY